MAGISLKKVSKRWGDFVGVQEFDLEIADKEFLVLLGPSGCGKTTALRIIAGFLEPEEGEVIIDGQSMANIPPNERPTNMVFQSYAIFPHLNVGDNVAYGLRKLGITKEERASRVRDALSMVELGGFEKRRIDQLSGGQRQRVALARALVMHPKVLLLDEPFAGMNHDETMNMVRLVKSVRDRGVTVLLVEHDMAAVMSISDRIIVLNFGEMIAEGTPTEIQNNDKVIEAYLGSEDDAIGM